jgi:DNA-binding transcriptional regulator YbjK
MEKTREPVQRRGAARREALLGAAVRLLARHGARAVTHRAVAEEAGTTHGAPRYYFATRSQLLDEALTRLADGQVARVRALLDAPREGNPRQRAAFLARALRGPVTGDRDETIARYELFLEAARRPALRDTIRAWGDAHRRLLAAELRATGSADPETDAELLLNLLNGLLLAQLAAPRPDFEQALLRPAIERFLG